MALGKIQNLIQKIAHTDKVKQVIAEVQAVSHDIQNKVQKLSADEAVKKYKELAKKVVAAENDLQKEVTKVVAQVKKSADEVEKNFKTYKAKAQAQRLKIEKMILAKTKTKAKTKKTAKKKVTTKKTVGKKTKRA
ncbi:MAG: hypothetical protein ACK4VO_12300 [Pseudobdellovibrio sp.]